MQKEFTALQKLMESMIEFIVTYSFDVLGAIIILIGGFWIANFAANFLNRQFRKKNLDITLANFLAGLAKILILAFAIIIALGKFGITIAPFIAALSAMAFGASFAFQGPLANYGAGLSIVLMRPFVVGDTITVQGQSGVVEEVTLALTHLITEDGVKITIPNKHIVGEIIFNSNEYRIADTAVGISYSDNPEEAIEVIKNILLNYPELSKKMTPQVGISEFGDSSVNIGLRYWVPTKQYYQIVYQVNLAVFKALKEKGITIPFPQRDVHVVSTANQGQASTLEEQSH